MLRPSSLTSGRASQTHFQNQVPMRFPVHFCFPRMEQIQTARSAKQQVGAVIIPNDRHSHHCQLTFVRRIRWLFSGRDPCRSCNTSRPRSQHHLNRQSIRSLSKHKDRGYKVSNGSSAHRTVICLIAHKLESCDRRQERWDGITLVFIGGLFK